MGGVCLLLDVSLVVAVVAVGVAVVVRVGLGGVGVEVLRMGVGGVARGEHGREVRHRGTVEGIGERGGQASLRLHIIAKVL